MPYKIPNLPSAKAYLEEKADFWEIQALIHTAQFFSQMSMSRAISKELDEIDHDGIESEDDKLDDNLSDTFYELTARHSSLQSRYPFEFGKYSIRLIETESPHRDIYLFLLLCTRFSMNKAENKVRNGVDATLIFEDLCAVVAENYLGENAKSLVFGTATEGNFENKIKNLIKSIGEGQGYKNPNQNYPTKNDDGIDVVVWRDFADNRISKLIGFGQCKTGTSWQDEVKKLNPEHFCENWLYEKPAFPPLRMVFICDTLNIEKNFVSDQRGILMFNRFRIMEYLPEELPQELLDKIRTWLSDALTKVA